MHMLLGRLLGLVHRSRQNDISKIWQSDAGLAILLYLAYALAY